MQKMPPVAIFLILSIFVVLSWFKDGLYLGGAEVGLSPFYNPTRYLNIQKYIWWGDIAPGVLVPQFINAVPLYFILSVLGSLFSSLVLQALLFLVLLFLIGYGMYLFALYILGQNRKFYAITAGLFYMFNSYMMVEVWHRFLYTGIFLAAAVPILILFWQRWIREGKFIFLVCFLLVNLTFSYMYGNLTSAIAVWVLCFLMTLAETIIPWQGKKFFLNITYKFGIGFLLFLLTNLWWLIPVFKVSTQVLPEQHSSEDNIGTLVNISKQTVLPFTLQYANPFYLFYNRELGDIYTNFIFLLLPWVPVVVIFFGIFFALKKKHLAVLALLYLFVIIIAKGAASPFGYPYIWGFIKIFFLGIIRNPFEKLGILIPLLGSLLFAVGIESLFLFFRKKFGRSIAITGVLIIFISVLIYAFPMFTGGVFNKPDYPLRIKVPKAYEQANNWFSDQKAKEGNILHLPFSGHDVATYNWENGYHGVEINEIIFTSLPSITRNIGIKRIDDTLESLTYIFIPPYSENKEQILNVLQKFNVKFIVLHKDIVWKDKNTYGEKSALLDPGVTEEVLDNLNFLKKEQQFGDLLIYRLTDESYKPIFYVPSAVQFVYPGQTGIMQILSFSKIDEDMITPLNNDQIHLGGIMVFPDRMIEDIESSSSAMVSQIDNIFRDQSKSAIIEQLFQMKNYFSSLGYLQSSKLIDDLILATEKILMLYRQAYQSMPPATNQLAEYELIIKDFFQNYSKDLSIHQLFGGYINNQLRMHRFILNKLGQVDIANEVEGFMIGNELLPAFRYNNGEGDIKRQIFKFNIPQAGFYQLLSKSSFQDKDLMIDGAKVVSIENLQINKGSYEISVNALNENFKDDMALKANVTGEASGSGQVSIIKKHNPVKYSGKIHIDKPAFVIFSQGFNPGWVLTLSKDGRQREVKDHFIGNLYSNAWRINQEGDFDFIIEFKPQNNVKNGIILSGLAWIGILTGLLYLGFNKRR